MADLIQPHGGRLVNRTTEDPQALAAQAAALPTLTLSAADVSTVYRMADGTLRPLTGPKNTDGYQRVRGGGEIRGEGREREGTRGVPFPVTADQAHSLGAGQQVALAGEDGQAIAVLEIESVFEWDKQAYLKSVYGTERTDHPGGDMVLRQDADKTHLIGGQLTALPQPADKAFSHYIKTPRQIRQELGQTGWDACVAFQTRNPLHRAHEYALLYGLETLLREGRDAGACLNPLVGETKSDDVSAEVRMQTYQRLIESREFGEGDKDPELWAKVEGDVADRVLLIGLDIKMFYAGPAEAVMHGIYRQNMGFSHIIIGRKHADAPFHDGEAIWGDFDAQHIFDDLPGGLDIQPVKVGFAAFYESMGRVDLMDNHPDEKPVFISGKQVRAMLQAGEQVDPRIMRPSTSRILAEAMAG